MYLVNSSRPTVGRKNFENKNRDTLTGIDVKTRWRPTSYRNSQDEFTYKDPSALSTSKNGRTKLTRISRSHLVFIFQKLQMKNET
ncbi:hypothetical protein V1478_010213 [Vespula squamosa]|uniref:Uncharacterized protein n=1 Tax=Vespula squamosa TaxID=30214 RepID=A0ABD2AJZ4_VESSQ